MFQEIGKRGFRWNRGVPLLPRVSSLRPRRPPCRSVLLAAASPAAPAPWRPPRQPVMSKFPPKKDLTKPGKNPISEFEPLKSEKFHI